MASYRCSMCNINWPVYPVYTACPLCNEKTTHGEFGTVTSSAEATELIERHKEQVENPPLDGIHPKAVFEHRYAAFMRMGFTPMAAEELADSRHDTHAVKKWLAQGCTLDTAMAILS